MRLRGLLGLGLYGIAVATSGCSSTTTVQMRNGQTLHGRIVGSDAEVVWLRSHEAGSPLDPADAEVAEGKQVAVVSKGYGGTWELEGTLTRWTEQRVCVQPHGDAEECVPSEDVESVTMHADTRVEREAIAQVEHPGGPAVVVGSVLAAASVPLLVYGSVDRKPEPTRDRSQYGMDPNFDKNLALGVGGALLVSGAITATLGAVQYFTSKSHFGARPHP